MHDSLANGKKRRILNIINDFNSELLSIILDTSLPSQRVIREIETLAEWRGRPDTIRSDNGPEFLSEALSQWCKKGGVEWIFIQPGKPTQNSVIERVNRTFRQDVLESYMLESLTELRKYSQSWAWIYNNERPHAALGNFDTRGILIQIWKAYRAQPKPVSHITTR